MADIFEKRHDLLNDQEIKFAKTLIASVVQNHSFFSITDISNICIDEEENRKLFFQSIKISKIITVEQKMKRRSKKNKYIIVGFQIVETVKNINYLINKYIQGETLNNNDKMNLIMNEKLKIIFEPMKIHNDSQVQYVLGFNYIKGKYIACKINKAIHYYLLSVNQKYSKEQIKIHVIYHEFECYRAKRDSFKEKLKDLPDGTYDFDTGNPIDFSGQKKYQVAFQTTSSEDETSSNYLTNEEYDALVEYFSLETGSKPYLGKFEVPETSFLCETFEQAMDLAKKFNQKSIWSWEIMDEIQNPDYDQTQNFVKCRKENKMK